MKVGDFSNLEVEGDDFDGIDASIDETNLGFMFDIVSKQMYRRPINSIVREITSNCFDSHIEAKVDDPVIIKFGWDETGDYVAFKDFGVGISPERMKKVYAKYFSSTKRDTNDQIGMFGLGSKSPLAYTDTFYLTTVFDKVKYEYMIHSGQKKPRIVPLVETETTERNQTEVRIYMKQSGDQYKFSDACATELIYFDNVYIDCYFKVFKANYEILDYTTFKFRKDYQYSRELHLLVGKVCYPINWEELDIPRIPIPCGLKFNIGDLQVTPERESIRYIEIEGENGELVSTKQIVLAKIEEFKKEILDLYQKQTVTEFEDYEEYKLFCDQKEAILSLGGHRIEITSIVPKNKAVFVPLKDFVGKIPTNLFYQWRTLFLYRKGSKLKAVDSQVNHKMVTETLCLMQPQSGKYSPKKLQYLYELAYKLTGVSQFYIIHQRPLQDYRKTALEVKLDFYALPRSYKLDYANTNNLKQYQLIESFIAQEVNRLTFQYDLIDVPPEWLKAYNDANKTTREKAEDSFLVYDYGKSLLSDNKEYLTVEQLEEFSGFIIYGFEQDEDLLRNFRSLLSSSMYRSSTQSYVIDAKICKLVKIAQRNEKYFIGLKNSFYIYDFMGNNKIFKRFATAALIEKESRATKLKGYKPNREETDTFPKVMQLIFPPVADALQDISDACDDFGKASYTRTDNPVSASFFEQLVSVAKEYNLYDEQMLEVHKKLERYVAGLELINYIVLKKESIPHLIDFLLAKSKRIDTIWTEPTQYEKELVQESMDKLKYQQSVLVDSKFKAKGTSFYVGQQFRHSSCTKTSHEATLLLEEVKEEQILFNTILQFYEHQATRTN